MYVYVYIMMMMMRKKESNLVEIQDDATSC